MMGPEGIIIREVQGTPYGSEPPRAKETERFRSIKTDRSCERNGKSCLQAMMMASCQFPGLKMRTLWQLPEIRLGLSQKSQQRVLF